MRREAGTHSSGPPCYMLTLINALPAAAAFQHRNTPHPTKQQPYYIPTHAHAYIHRHTLLGRH